MRELILKIYAGLFAFIFALVFVAQGLGFIGIYHAPLALISTLLVTGLAYWAYQRNQSLQSELHSEALSSKSLQLALVSASILLIGFIFVGRMLLFPYSEFGKAIPVDFFAYHGIKMLDFARSGSLWNLAIPYADYPNGYESLAAFFLMFVEDMRVLGLVHALITVLLWLTIALLLVRYTKMPMPLALFLAVLSLFIPNVYPFVVQIGKNDVLLSLTILIAILHAPIGNRSFHPLGLAFATMLSLATKATGLYILFYLWGLVLIFWFLAWRGGTAKAYLHPRIFLSCIGIMFVGGLWVLRNFAVLGQVFTPEVASFFTTSIGANLTNSMLLHSGSESLGLIFGLVSLVALSVFAFFKKELAWTVSLLILMIGLTFILTPLSAFLTPQLDYLAIQWRFVLHGFIFFALVAIVFLWTIFKPLYEQVVQQKMIARAIAGGIVLAAFTIVLIFDPRDLLSYTPSQAELLRDPYGDEHSVYDVANALDGGILYIENANWFTLMYANPNISVMQGSRYPLRQAGVYPIPSPDYMIFTPKRYIPEPTFVDLDRVYQWELIYEDETGRLYQRIP